MRYWHCRPALLQQECMTNAWVSSRRHLLLILRTYDWVDSEENKSVEQGDSISTPARLSGIWAAVVAGKDYWMLNMVTLGLMSLVVGFLGSLTGLGGASILIPMLVLFGIPVKEAIASGMVAIIATSSGSASSFVREHITNVKVAMYLEMFTITGAIVGATITTVIHPTFLYFFFAVFLLTAFLRFRGALTREFTPSVSQDKLSKWLGLRGRYYDECKREIVEYQVNNSLLGGAGMLVAGLAAGMLGIGAGAFKVTVQENILRMPPKVSSTTSNFIIGMTALAGVSVYLLSGLLNLTLMAPMAIGTTVGALAGGRILNRVSNRVLRILFFAIVALLVAQMLYKGVSSI